jgi:hypothetical protein
MGINLKADAEGESKRVQNTLIFWRRKKNKKSAAILEQSLRFNFA